MKVYKDCGFHDIEIEIDDVTFVSCRFRFCRLIYSGGPIPRLEACFMQGCRFEFRDAAARTVALFQSLGMAMGQAVETAVNC